MIKIKVSQGCLGDEELAAVKEAFSYGYFGHSTKVIEFEKRLSEFFGGRHVVAVNTGTTAIHLALEALGIGPGDQVIVPSLTFVATFQAISATGAEPVPCDILPETLCVDPEDVKRRLTPKTKAIIPVHYSGIPCDMGVLLKLAQENGIRVVEDAAHAFGSTYEGKQIGSFGDITCFSFDSIKNITCGEGGCIVTSDPELADLMAYKRLLGINRKEGISGDKRWLYEVTTQGYRYHMSNINGAIGLVQLKRFPGFMERRRQICKKYVAAFSGVHEVKMLKSNYSEVSPHIFPIRVPADKRDKLIGYLNGQGIEVSIHYVPNHHHQFYRDLNAALPVTEMVYPELVSLPLHCLLSDSDVDEVIKAVKAFFGK